MCARYKGAVSDRAVSVVASPLRRSEAVLRGRPKSQLSISYNRLGLCDSLRGKGASAVASIAFRAIEAATDPEIRAEYVRRPLTPKYRAGTGAGLGAAARTSGVLYPLTHSEADAISERARRIRLRPF